ncbi:tetratricopeptide repeat protein [Reichenbachiella versicolor]|uniref:tetratricopeptide repeat protein n=1 Tax=Reichenbachiella versicolor TaxID=1821036 RepID=UPI0013A53515|nr:tetratricopeptide repeat protein [Reichenbachiella versicolor]
MKRSYIHKSVLFSILLLCMMLIGGGSAYSQKKKKKKSEKASETVVLSEEQVTELEHYFLEGEKYFILGDRQKAYSFFEKVLELDSDNAAANYKLGQILLENRELNKALPFANRSVELSPKNKFYYLQLANIQTTIGQLEAAEKTYFSLVENVEGTENHLFELAAIQLYQKKYDDAIVTYNLAETKLGTMEEIYQQRQQIYLKQNKLDLAIDEGKRLVGLYPNEKSHVLNLGRIMISNDRLTEAKEFLEESVKVNPDEEELFILLAEVYRKNGDPEKALQSLKVPFGSSSVDLNAKIRTLAGYLGMLPNEKLNDPLMVLGEILVGTHPDSYQALAMIGDLHYNVQEKEQARSYYLKAVKIDGSNFNIWQNILSLDMDLRDYDGAIDHANLALETFPNQSSLYYFSGTAYLIKKDYENAIKTFNTGKAYTARDNNMKSLFHGQLGDAYNSMGDHEKSDASYEAALKAKPDNDHVLNNYSYFLSLRKKDLEKAKLMSGKIVKAYPENPTYLDTHAWVLYMMEDYEGAAKYLKMALDFDPSAVIVEHYGDALFQLGRIDEALVQWKRARELSSDDSTNLETLDKKIASRQLYE